MCIFNLNTQPFEFKYELTYTGDDKNICPNNCGGNGECSGLKCTCKGNYVGPSCEDVFPVVSNNHRDTVDIKPRSFFFFLQDRTDCNYILFKLLVILNPTFNLNLKEGNVVRMFIQQSDNVFLPSASSKIAWLTIESEGSSFKVMDEIQTTGEDFSYLIYGKKFFF